MMDSKENMCNILSLQQNHRNWIKYMPGTHLKDQTSSPGKPYCGAIGSNPEAKTKPRSYLLINGATGITKTIALDQSMFLRQLELPSTVTMRIWQIQPQYRSDWM